MPSLTETQVPFFERDVRKGLVPERFLDETVVGYHGRLAILYGLSREIVSEKLED